MIGAITQMVMLTPLQMLADALYLCTFRHLGQYDKQGRPYALHPLKVMHYLRSEDWELCVMALLHDVIEDTKVTYAELRERGYSERVIQGLHCLTRVPGETEEQYEIRVCSNWDSIRVKQADLRHNSDIRRLKGLTQKDHDRIAKYHAFYVKLTGIITAREKEMDKTYELSTST